MRLAWQSMAWQNARDQVLFDHSPCSARRDYSFSPSLFGVCEEHRAPNTARSRVHDMRILENEIARVARAINAS